MVSKIKDKEIQERYGELLEKCKKLTLKEQDQLKEHIIARGLLDSLRDTLYEDLKPLFQEKLKLCEIYFQENARRVLVEFLLEKHNLRLITIKNIFQELSQELLLISKKEGQLELDIEETKYNIENIQIRSKNQKCIFVDFDSTDEKIISLVFLGEFNQEELTEIAKKIRLIYGVSQKK